jgi:hypothetical protein
MAILNPRISARALSGAFGISAFVCPSPDWLARRLCRLAEVLIS